MCSFLVASFLLTAATLKHANYYLRYRGPDYTKKDVVGGWTFVHNLLSMTGNFTTQPFLSSDRNVVAVYNGEIYNYNNLGLGRFPSDGYAILPAYKKYKDRFAEYFNGEYAIVLTDFSIGKIYLVSDAFCTKPLWYAVWTDNNGKKQFATASYQSALLRLGAHENECTFIHPNTMVTMNINSYEVISSRFVIDWDLTQYKTHTRDWEQAFQNAVARRTRDVKHKIFIGLSEGYDSGGIMLALTRARVNFMSYTILGKETPRIIERRILVGKSASADSYMPCVVFPSEINKNKERLWLDTHSEPFNYSLRPYESVNEQKSLNEDKAAWGLSHILRTVRKRGGLIYLSGSGADEIMSDYAVNGRKIFKHSSFNGIFPRNLSEIFPWQSFYLGTQRDYLMKEELVGGAHGIESRYPFLDPEVVQEFLWLNETLKNSLYKKPLADYLTKYSFPYRNNSKVGFNLKPNKESASRTIERLKDLSFCGDL